MAFAARYNVVSHTERSIVTFRSVAIVSNATKTLVPAISIIIVGMATPSRITHLLVFKALPPS